MDWFEVIVHTTTAGSDEISCLLMEAGASGTMIEDRADIPDPSKPHGIWEIIDPALPDMMPEDVLVHAWLNPDELTPSSLESMQSSLASLSASRKGYGSLQLETRSVNDTQWKDVWKKYYKPFYAGEHLVIKPTWEPFTPRPDDKVIEIDPGMAFGSGSHETTAMCLTLLEQNIRGGESVIDVGTGSGILAIGAALFGAGSVLAVDIDPDAVRVANENVSHNHVDSVVTVCQGNLLDHVDAVCDLCVANIISDIIISFAAPLMSHVRPGGLFICSGIVSSRAAEVRTALENASWEILKMTQKGEWTAFLTRRNL